MPIARRRAWSRSLGTAKDHVATAREAKIKEYHDEHGNEGKRNVDDAQVWGTGLLPGE
jgi:hypothetical protein